MTRPALVLRPAPGAERTAERLRAAGLVARLLPLFAVRPCAWTPPDPAEYDALLLTSANAVRHGGAGLARLARLPVVAVGPATAAAARAASLRVVAEGRGDAADAAALAPGRLLHLAGRERRALPGIDAVVVYASEALPVTEDAAAGLARGAVVLAHSPRAARRIAALLPREARAGARLAALSAAVAAAAWDGWGAVGVAPVPGDAALVALAATLAIDP